jgi:hypothetical protein
MSLKKTHLLELPPMLFFHIRFVNLAPEQFSGTCEMSKKSVPQTAKGTVE